MEKILGCALKKTSSGTNSLLTNIWIWLEDSRDSVKLTLIH